MPYKHHSKHSKRSKRSKRTLSRKAINRISRRLRTKRLGSKRSKTGKPCFRHTWAPGYKYAGHGVDLTTGKHDFTYVLSGSKKCGTRRK